MKNKIIYIQLPVYNHCYHKNKNFYDWIGFFDFDEYLYIENNSNIKTYIFDKRFDKCETIFFNWVIYNDNDLVRYDNRSLMKRFTKAKINCSNGKSFVRGYKDNLIIPTSMIPGINIYNFCNSNGEKIYPKTFFGNTFENNPMAFIKHFYTKTAEEFCNKINKGDVAIHTNYFKFAIRNKEKLNLFYRINNLNKEKLDILKKCLYKYLI